MNKRDAIRLCKEKYRAYVKRDHPFASSLEPALCERIQACIHACPLCQYVKDKTGNTPYADKKGYVQRVSFG